jgi:hypothetical protein
MGKLCHTISTIFAKIFGLTKTNILVSVVIDTADPKSDDFIVEYHSKGFNPWVRGPNV